MPLVAAFDIFRCLRYAAGRYFAKDACYAR